MFPSMTVTNRLGMQHARVLQLGLRTFVPSHTEHVGRRRLALLDSLNLPLRTLI